MMALLILPDYWAGQQSFHHLFELHDHIYVALGQHKCGHVIKLDDGNFAIQPNNRCRAFEPSFVAKPGQNLIERKLGTQMWSVENTAKWVLSDDDRYDYEVKNNA